MKSICLSNVVVTGKVVLATIVAARSRQMNRTSIFAAAAMALSTAAPAFAAEQTSQPATSEVIRIAPGLEKMHARGQEQEAKGLKALAEAEQDASAARAKILEGQRLITEGSTGVEMQRTAYRQLVADAGFATTAKEAKIESNSLDSIVKAWDASEETADKGARIVKAAKKDLEKAEKRKRKAEKRIAEARESIALATIAAPQETSSAKLNGHAPEASKDALENGGGH